MASGTPVALAGTLARTADVTLNGGLALRAALGEGDEVEEVEDPPFSFSQDDSSAFAGAANHLATHAHAHAHARDFSL